MGQSFIQQSQKDFMQNKFNDLHETFARPITIYKTAEKIVISSNPAHNFMFQGAPTNDIVQNVIQSGVFKARILYAKKEGLENFDDKKGQGGSQPVVRISQGDVRLKLDPTGMAFLQGCERVTFDGTVFQVLTDQRPQGLFTPNFYSIYLKKVN